jgi:hypothetical protein
MHFPGFHIWIVFALGGSTPGHAAGIAWPDAVGRLRGERVRAETCIALLKQYGNGPQISRGRLTYSEAKRDSDYAIDGLLTVLDRKPTQGSIDFPDLDVKLRSATSTLAVLCNTVSELVPSTSGVRERSGIVDIVKAAVEPFAKYISDGFAALYNNHRSDNEMTRRTIQTRLEAARWPNFTDIKAAK